MKSGAEIQVVGVGNDYMGDDGVGIHVVDELRRAEPAHLDLLDCGTDLLRIASQHRPCQSIIIVDAIRVGERPGSIHWFAPDDVQNASVNQSVHQLSIIENLKLLPLMNAYFSQSLFHIVGIEPGNLHFGQELSAEVQTSADRLVDMLACETGARRVLAKCRRHSASAA